MAVILCVAGAVVGLIIALISNLLVLPMVLRSWDAQVLRDPTFRLTLWGPLIDVRRMRALIIAAYRYAFPLVFAVVGASAAYRLFIADAP